MTRNRNAEDSNSSQFALPEIVVLPRGAGDKRTVKAVMHGETHEDRIDSREAKARNKFLDEVAKLFSIDRDCLNSLHSAIRDRAAEADSRLEEAVELNASDDDADAAKQNQATILVGLAQDAELFHTPEMIAYATIAVNEHHETHEINGDAFERWLRGRYFERFESVPNKQALNDAVNTLDGIAQFEGRAVEVHVRLARHNDAIYLDLCDEEWSVIEITEKGRTSLAVSPCKFRRASGMLSLPKPEEGGDIHELRGCLNVATDNDYFLLLAFLLAALNPDGPFFVLILHGDQGSAKSSTATILRSLIDPNKALHRSLPGEERDLVIMANNGWLISLDNLSFLSQRASDALCRLATTGGFSTRELYTDAGETIFDCKRPIILNGIDEIATRSDLLDRSIIVYLPVIPPEDRRTEKELKETFAEALPRILGSLLRAVSTAIRRLPEMEEPKKLPRMADAALWIQAAEPALGVPEGSLLSAYWHNQNVLNRLALEASPIAKPIFDLGDKLRFHGKATWTGTATELKTELERSFDKGDRLPKYWPGDARALSNRLSRIAPNLAAIGIQVKRSRAATRKRERQITIDFGEWDDDDNIVTTDIALTDDHDDSYVDEDCDLGAIDGANVECEWYDEEDEPGDEKDEPAEEHEGEEGNQWTDAEENAWADSEEEPLRTDITPADYTDTYDEDEAEYD